MAPALPGEGAPTAGAQPPPLPPGLIQLSRAWPGLDRLGVTQAAGGLAIGLITLLSSDDHIHLLRWTLQLEQQWGVAFIAASVAIVLVESVSYSAPPGRDAQLATRARDRGTYERDRDRDLAREERLRADQERHQADRERYRADQERNRAAEARQRQAESLECLRQAAVLSARFQLEPTDTHRARLNAFLTLLSNTESTP